MEITRDEPAFRPVTIRLETQDDLDKLLAVVGDVAANKVTYNPAVVRAATKLFRELSAVSNED